MRSNRPHKCESRTNCPEVLGRPFDGCSARLLSAQPGLGQFGAGKPYLPGESHRLKRADHEVGEIELPPPQTVTGRPWEGVMIVVPALAQAQDTKDRVVATLIPRAKWASAPDVADGVDAESDVMHEKNAV